MVYELPALAGADPVTKAEIAVEMRLHSNRIAREESRLLIQRTAEEWLESPIAEMPEPMTAYLSAVLDKQGIILVRDLLSRTKEQLLAIRQIGPRNLQNILGSLAAIGFTRQRQPTPQPQPPVSLSRRHSTPPLRSIMPPAKPTKHEQERIFVTIPPCDFFNP